MRDTFLEMLVRCDYADFPVGKVREKRRHASIKLFCLLFFAKTLAIRRIADDETLFVRCVKVFEIRNVKIRAFNPCIASNHLERTPCHLLLSFRGGKQAFVSASEDTYLCTVERDGAKTSVAFKIQCMMGIQMII